MEIEIQGMLQSIKPRYQTKVKTHRTELNALKKRTVRPFPYDGVSSKFYNLNNRESFTPPRTASSYSQRPPTHTAHLLLRTTLTRVQIARDYYQERHPLRIHPAVSQIATP